MTGEIWICPECFRPSQPTVSTTTENSDADGNRGIKVKCVVCEHCDHEECWAV